MNLLVEPKSTLALRPRTFKKAARILSIVLLHKGSEFANYGQSVSLCISHRTLANCIPEK